MSQGCSILVLMVKKYPEEVCRREPNPSPHLRQAKARLPGRCREEGGGSLEPTFRMFELPSQACAFTTARSPRDVHTSGAGLLLALLVAPYGPV